MISKLMQKITMSTPQRAKWFLSTMKPSFFEKKGKGQALNLFNQTVENIPAYRSFLESKNFDVRSVENTDDFQKVPIIDKASYIRKYPLDKRCVCEDISETYAMSSSSGATGQATYWPRTAEFDSIVPKAMDLLFSDIIHTGEKSTLIVVTLGLGMWSAGDICAAACRELASREDYNITVVTPGLKVDDSLDVIKKIGKKYDQTLLIGYPPFLRDIIEIGAEQDVDWKKLSTKIMTGGEGISEKWRDYMLNKIGSKKLYDISSLFATADAGIIGFETPFSIVLRRLVENSNALNKKLFNGSDAVSIVQYNPMAKYFEEVDGEIVLTSSGVVPLVRYNIHDRGKILPFQKVLETLEEEKIDMEKEMEKFGYDFSKIFKLPVFVAYGRSDAIHFYAVNIYRENIMNALEDSAIVDSVTGLFKVKVIEDKKVNPVLTIKVELAKGKSPTDELTKTIQKTIQECLCKLNSEYSELSKYLSEKNKGTYMPDVELYKYKESKYFGSYKIKHKYI